MKYQIEKQDALGCKWALPLRSYNGGRLFEFHVEALRFRHSLASPQRMRGVICSPTIDPFMPERLFIYYRVGQVCDIDA